MRVRSITPHDGPAYRSILARTSVEDRYFRFFRAVDNLDPADVRRAVEDRPDMLGFIAEEHGRPLGVAHAALLADGTAELAIVVAEDARERGVARALLLATIAHLRELGIERAIAHSLHENVAFTRLAHAVGLRIEHVEGVDLQWSLALQPARGDLGPVAAQALVRVDPFARDDRGAE